MEMAKRQIILGALILALGAAVYLNWQFSDMVEIESTDASVESEIETENLGVAQLVNNSYLETVNDEIPSEYVTQDEVDDMEIATYSDDVLSDARVSRQEARDEAIEILETILDDNNSDSATISAAVEKSAEIAQNILDETTAETLIMAKGIDDVVVYINSGECNVIVNELGDNSLIIQDIMNNQIGIDLDKIHIIEAQ